VTNPGFDTKLILFANDKFIIYSELLINTKLVINDVLQIDPY